MMQSDLAGQLRQRGHEITHQGNERDLLLPNSTDPAVTSSFKEVLYNLMHRDAIRKGLRDWAYGNEIGQSNSARNVIESYRTLCNQFGGWKTHASEALPGLYATTFEWYVSELMKREFSARASGMEYA